ncbi:TRAP transporter large permease subunit [uncultured Sulfitobacter sp.]|uniref:TRAP transporter large permease n=1 Tax=uncultured Sulfitobacter sp. TaxID=191468 RepID=UPI00262F6CDD|nr:TRAP transporter large permease subunit [uncultured Sulfitobacter sp.]
MNAELYGFLSLPILVVLLAFRIPIAVALGSVAMVGLYLILGFEPMIGASGSLTFDFVASWELSAIPLFIFMGAISAHSGLVASLYQVAQVWLARVPGGLAVATNFSAAGFAAASGSSLATTAAMGELAFPEMQKARYQPSLSTAVIASSGTLGSLIPPSILLVIYGLIAEVSIGDLLLAGIIPGVLTAMVYATMIIVRCTFNPDLAPRDTEAVRVPLVERLLMLRSIWPLPVLVLAVVGTIYSGFATATEAAAVGSLAAFLIALGMRRLNWDVFLGSIKDTLHMTSMIFFIVLGAALYSKFLAITGTPEVIAQTAAFGRDNPYLLFLVMAAVFLFLGMFVDSLGMMLLTLPIFIPLVQETGFSLIWFGVFVVKWVEIGLITPPVGMNAFVVKGVVGDEVSIGTIFKGLTWFVAVEFLIVAVLTLYPEIVTFLPDLANSGQ